MKVRTLWQLMLNMFRLRMITRAWTLSTIQTQRMNRKVRCSF